MGLTVTPKLGTLTTTEGFVVTQNGHQMYVVKIKASELLKVLDVERVEAVATGAQDGYQRPERPKRIKSVKEFVKAGNPIPPALVLSSRTQPRSLGKGSWLWTAPLFAVDGQHRAGGLREAIAEYSDPRFANFEFTCVIKVCADAAEEQKLFVDINRGQKPVTNDYTVLAQYNLGKAGRKDLIENDATLSNKSDWQPKALEVALKLNRESSTLPVANPLLNRIKLLNVDAEALFANPVTQGTIIKSLEPILLSSDVDNRTIGTELVAFWRGVALTWGVAVRDAGHYHILRNLGVQIMHSLFMDVRKGVVRLKGDPANPLHYHKVLELGHRTQQNKYGASDGDWSTIPSSPASMIGGTFRAGGTLFAGKITDAINRNFFALGTKL